MTLDDEQIKFLSNHSISLDELFNAAGLSRSEYQKKMQQQNKYIAFGVSPCENGHSLRTRAGHCVQCNPARLAFMERHVLTGQVYIAGSLKGQLIKVGFTKEKSVRAESLNRTKYGGFDDWVILCTGECDNAGKIESEVSKKLKNYSVSMDYKHDGSVQKTYELFSCSYQTAFSAIKKIQEESNDKIFKSLKEDKLRSINYAFRNLVRNRLSLIIIILLSLHYWSCSVEKPLSVEIGEQTWMLNNLDVSTFRNGDTIPQAATSDEWIRAQFYSKKGELNDKYPTVDQYTYWGRKLNNIEELKKAEVGEVNYNKDYDPLTGFARDAQRLFGIGSEAQLDTTKDDTHALSLILENTYIGRLTLFLLIDSASAMPLGVLLIPDEPSYETTCLCLTNAASDKVAFCKKLGIDIKPEDWPARHLPSKILSDMGLLFGKKRSSIVNNLKIEIDNCAPLRPDLKPIVESYIGKILRSISGILNGYGLVNKRDSPRTAANTKKEAILNYRQILRIMVLEILHFIKYIPIDDYPLSPHMMQIDLYPTPLNIWNYYMENGMHAFIDIPEDLELKLLPQTSCAFSDDGIRFEGDDWICTNFDGKEIYKTLLFGKKAERVSVAFSSVDTTKVYLFVNGVFYPLSPRLDNVSQRTFYEVRMIRKRTGALHKNNRSARKSAAVRKVYEQQETLKEAKREAKKHGDVKTTETRDSRNVDKEHYHNTESSPEKPFAKQQPMSKVITRYSLPDFTEDL